MKKTTMKQENSDALYHKQHLQREKELSSKLGLESKIQEKLQSRHSMTAISRFFEKYTKLIQKQHYLYELPASLPSARSTTFKPDWCETDKIVYTLDSYAYCLFTRKEYKLALASNVSKGILFYSLCIFFY